MGFTVSRSRREFDENKRKIIFTIHQRSEMDQILDELATLDIALKEETTPL